MRFWMLTSYFRSEPHLLDKVFSDPRWHQYAEWFRDLSSLVNRQDRAVLDSEVPPELCRAALSLTPRKYILREGWLQEATEPKAEAEARRLSALDVYDRYGGECLEEIQESGSWHAP